MNAQKIHTPVQWVLHVRIPKALFDAPAMLAIPALASPAPTTTSAPPMCITATCTAVASTILGHFRVYAFPATLAMGFRATHSTSAPPELTIAIYMRTARTLPALLLVRATSVLRVPAFHVTTITSVNYLHTTAIFMHLAVIMTDLLRVFALLGGPEVEFRAQITTNAH
jgi:hypothetical protein